MPRRYVIKKAEINKRRALNWATHYERRNQVRVVGVGMDCDRVAAMIARYIPAPEMNVEGWWVDGLESVKGRKLAIEALGLSWELKDLMCVWYWTEEHWMEFVRQFQKLDDPTEDYYLLYDAGRDAALIVPMSSKPKQGSGKGEVHPVDNSGTSRVHLAEMYPRAAISAVRSRLR